MGTHKLFIFWGLKLHATHGFGVQFGVCRPNESTQGSLNTSSLYRMLFLSFYSGLNPSKIEWDLTSGPLDKVLELLQ